MKWDGFVLPSLPIAVRFMSRCQAQCWYGHNISIIRSPVVDILWNRLYISSGMDGQFFRKDQSQKTPAKWLKKLWKRKRFRLGILILLPVISFVLFGNRGVIQRMNLESEKKELEAKVVEAKKEQQRLHDLSKSLDNDPKVIEKVAREKYVMIREGETVYKVKKEK